MLRFSTKIFFILLCLSGTIAFGQDPALNPPKVWKELPEAYRDNARVFQGISSLEVTDNNRLWLTWYSGGITENAENYVLVATSGDRGKTWSKPLFAIDPPGIVRAFDPSIWLDPNGKLWLFWAQGEESTFKPSIWDGRAGVWCMTTANPQDGEKALWSAPRRLCDGIMMCKPVVDSKKRWLFPVAIWRFDSKFNLGNVKGANVFVSTDQGNTLSRLGLSRVPIDVSIFDEHNLIEKKDGSFWLLARTKYGIGESLSVDGGKTWPDLSPSVLKHTSSRFFIRRLASGNLLLVKNGPVDKNVGRSQMTAFLSTDDGKNWTGGLVLDARNNVSYPDGGQAPDGTIFITYDFDRYNAKEIYVARFREEDVKAGKLVHADSQLNIIANKATGKK